MPVEAILEPGSNLKRATTTFTRSRRVWSYALVRPAGSVARRTGILLCLVVSASLLADSGAIHLQLWSMGYRNIPEIGPLFLLQGISGLVLAAILLSRRLLVVATAAGFMIATIGGLLLSVYLRLCGFMETLAAPYAGDSLGVESSGAVVLAVAGIVLVRGRSGSRHRVTRRTTSHRSPDEQPDPSRAMTRSSSSRERKSTVWDSKIAVCRRFGFLQCEDQVEHAAVDVHVAKSCDQLRRS